MRRMNLMRVILFMALAVLLATGCAKKPAPTPVIPPVEEAPVTSGMPEGQDTRGFGEQAISETPAQDRLLPQADATTSGLQRIHYDFDQYTLTPQAREILASNAEYLKANPRVKVRVEGHTDERGSDEYNLALGERRARAARDYLISLGISGDRLSTVSYGEEMPLDPSGGESAYAQNRRAEFNVVYP